MEPIQIFLIAFSAIWLILALCIAIKKVKRADVSLGDFGSFIGGSITPIALLWAIYGQSSQTEIIMDQIKKLSPYFSISVHHKNFEYYENQEDFFHRTFIKPKVEQSTKSYENEKLVIEKYYIDNPEEEHLKLKLPVFEKDESKKDDLKKEISKLYESPFFKEILKEKYEKSKLKNGSQVLEIKITNLGEKLEIIEIKNENFFIENSPETEYTTSGNETVINFRIPINYFWENEDPITFKIRGRDNQNKFREYELTLKINEKTRILVDKEKLSMAGSLRFEDKISLSRNNISELTSEIHEL